MPDSLIGVISVTGTAFEQRILLRSGDRVTYLAAEIPDSIALAGLGGLEVVVEGRQSSKAFLVTRFTVLRINGAPVADGTLRSDHGRLTLDTRFGSIPLGNPPDALRRLVPSRVWISGPLDTGPNSFGLISRRP